MAVLTPKLIWAISVSWIHPSPWKVGTFPAGNRSRKPLGALGFGNSSPGWISCAARVKLELQSSLAGRLYPQEDLGASLGTTAACSGLK